MTDPAPQANSISPRRPTGQFKTKNPNPLQTRDAGQSHANRLADGYNRTDPEHTKDFNRAYKSLVNQKTQYGADRIGLVPESDPNALHRYQQLSERDHIRREEIFYNQKVNRIEQSQEEQAIRDLEECTFEPNLAKTARVNEALPERGLYDFLNDQQRFLEYKQIANLKGQQEAINKEISQVTLTPEVDGLSSQIVEMMDERKGIKTHDRLYKNGHEKLRQVNLTEYQKQQEKEIALYKRPNTDKERVDPTRDYHREKPTRQALHELHADLQQKHHIKAQLAEQERLMLANKSHKNKESVHLVMTHFQREFREAMGSQDDDLNSKLMQELEFSQVATIMLKMGFLQSNSSHEQEEQLDDLYSLLRCHKDQRILAENLQTVLLAIEGVRDPASEHSNDMHRNSWQNCGVFDDHSGLFYLRNGEHNTVGSHFKLLSVNRLQLKKIKHNYKYKRAPEGTPFQPTLNDKTHDIANKRRYDIFKNSSDNRIENVLLHPYNNGSKKEADLQKIREEIETKEQNELTFHPTINTRANASLLKNRQKPVRTGDTNIDLYYQSTWHEKRNKDTEEVEYELQQDQCRFQPDTSKREHKVIPDKQSVVQVKGMEKQLLRLEKARSDAAFKKKMTERSTYSATDGVRLARKEFSKGYTPKSIIPSNRKTKKPLANKTRSPLARPGPQRGSPINLAPQYMQPEAYRPQRDPPSPEGIQVNLAHEDLPKNAHHDQEDSEELVDQQLDQMEDRIDDRDPKLYVDVNIGKNGMERIIVYEGDTAEGLAAKFCEKHGLNDDMKEKLKLLLDQQIAGVLPKIMEDDDANSDDSEAEDKMKS